MSHWVTDIFILISRKTTFQGYFSGTCTHTRVPITRLVTAGKNTKDRSNQISNKCFRFLFWKNYSIIPKIVPNTWLRFLVSVRNEPLTAFRYYLLFKGYGEQKQLLNTTRHCFQRKRENILISIKQRNTLSKDCSKSFPLH